MTKHIYEIPNAIVNGTRTIPTLDQLAQAFSGIHGDRAGLVLTYVHAPGDGEGQALARQVNTRLTQAQPAVFTTDTIYEDFDYKDRSLQAYGNVMAEIYFVSNECSG